LCGGLDRKKTAVSQALNKSVRGDAKRFTSHAF
jgi:hypothetical protein